MKAAVLHGVKKPITVEELTLDDLQPDEVRVRTAASGLCHSDYHIISGDMAANFPTVLGHEAAGVVEAVGSQVRTFKPGDHVVTCASLYCGSCPACIRGRIQRCTVRPGRGPKDKPRLRMGEQPVEQRTGISGHSEALLVHQNSLAKLPREMPLDRGAVLGCAVVTGIGAAANSAKVAPGDSVAVIGCGGVGLNAIQGARLCGAGTIIAVDTNPAKLELAKKFGATDVVLGGEGVVERVKQIAKGGVDHAIEVIGLLETIQQGYRMLGSGGTLTLVGVPAKDVVLSLPGQIMNVIGRELRIQGSLMGSSPFTVDIPRYAALYLKGRLELDLLVSKRIKLGEINEGYADMLGGRVARSVIVFDDVLREAARG
jgi:S-(hydroxymethyl)glutathione dehydrogenase/alcohol dehydrogenase